jgi:cell wall assembly regulator SMI1
VDGTQIDLLEQALADIEEWMADNDAASFVDTLLPGASDAALAAAQQHFGVPLLPALEALYRWHDGQSGEVEPFFEHMFFLSLAEACRLRSALLECYFVPPKGMPLREYHRPHAELGDDELTSREWFPFANTDGDYLAVNLESGRVVRVLKGDVPWITLEAGDLPSFVGQYASDLWDGRFELHGDPDQPGVTQAGLVHLSRYFARA